MDEVPTGSMEGTGNEKQEFHPSSVHWPCDSLTGRQASIRISNSQASTPHSTSDWDLVLLDTSIGNLTSYLLFCRNFIGCYLGRPCYLWIEKLCTLNDGPNSVVGGVFMWKYWMWAILIRLLFCQSLFGVMQCYNCLMFMSFVCQTTVKPLVWGL